MAMAASLAEVYVDELIATADNQMLSLPDLGRCLL